MPKLERGLAVRPKPTSGRVLLPALVLLVAWGVAWHAGKLFGDRTFTLVAALGALATLGLGVGYDGVRRVVHDHGDSPERALILLVPLSLGALLPGLLPRVQRFEAARAWLPCAAACTLLSTWMLLLPTAYYYGSRRAVVLAGSLGCVALLVDAARRGALKRAGMGPLLGLLFAGLVLASLYPVRQLGAETAGAATFVLDARLYNRAAWLPLLLAKGLLFALVIAPSAIRRPLDCAAAAGLLTASSLIELSGARLPSASYPSLLVLLMVGALLCQRRAPSSLFAGALLLLGPLYDYDPIRIAPNEMILAATATALFAWRPLSATRAASSWFNGLTVALASYLMLWPSVGFHLAGIDFRFMFQWLPERLYLAAWQLIALGVAIKLALPLLLISVVAGRSLTDGASKVATGTLAAKTLLLSLLIACYAATHSVLSQQATAMLAELLLVMFSLASLALASVLVRRNARANYADGAHSARSELRAGAG